MNEMFFNGWTGIARVLIVGFCAYVALVLLLRGFGKRSLSKMNAFDFVVTVALGSTLASVLLSRDVALAEGVAAFATLLLLQFIVTWSSVRAPWVRHLVTGDPHLLFYRGRILESALRQQRVNEMEVQAAVRMAGIPDMAGVEAVVLETDGSFTVIPRHEPADDSSLANVVGHPVTTSRS